MVFPLRPSPNGRHPGQLNTKQAYRASIRFHPQPELPLRGAPAGPAAAHSTFEDYRIARPVICTAGRPRSPFNVRGARNIPVKLRQPRTYREVMQRATAIPAAERRLQLKATSTPVPARSSQDIPQTWQRCRCRRAVLTMEGCR